jgi:uncharacterized membrane protein
MLVPIPIGLWVFSLVADIVVRAGWGGPAWIEVARYTMAGGIVGALLAAVPGLIDFRSFRHPDTRRIGRTHLTLNLVIVAMYVVNFLLRTPGVPAAGLPILLSVVAIVLLLVSGWLGGEMVYVHGAGVEPPEARPDVRIRTEARERARPA